MMTKMTGNLKSEGLKTGRSSEAFVLHPEKGSITISLKKGTIGCNPKQRATVRGLGLRGRGSTRTLENTAAVRGMIKKVLHLLEIVSEVRPVVQA